MTIIVFLIDTSASMNQRVYLGSRPTLLDVAKSAVETFVKVCWPQLTQRWDCWQHFCCRFCKGWRIRLRQGPVLLLTAQLRSNLYHDNRTL